MATLYEFCVAYTKLGVGAAPSSAPTIKVVDSDDNVLVNAATATTALINLAGAYRYSYSGADGLICYAKFTTTDLTVDQYDLFSSALINPVVQNIHDTDLPAVKADTAAILIDTGTTLDSAISTMDGILDDIHGTDLPAVKTETASIKAKTDNLPADPADESLLEAAISAIPAGSSLDAAGVRTAVGLASANLDSQLSLITGGVAGSGAITWIYTLLDGVGNPIQGAEIWASTDISGSNVVASGTSNAFGKVTFYLDANSYYIWCQKAGYNFVNPDVEVVS